MLSLTLFPREIDFLGVRSRKDPEEVSDVTMNKRRQPVLPSPQEQKESNWTVKIERAKEIREGTSKIREGKPIAFPTRRIRP